MFELKEKNQRLLMFPPGDKTSDREFEAILRTKEKHGWKPTYVSKGPYFIILLKKESE
jgi:hypothetical protein